jgi:hypothetical protein
MVAAVVAAGIAVLPLRVLRGEMRNVEPLPEKSMTKVLIISRDGPLTRVGGPD